VPEPIDDIRRWYADHGEKFIAEDWGERDENGESIGPQRQEPERSYDIAKKGSTSVRSTDPSPERTWWWEKQTFPWKPRNPGDQEWVFLLDEFFAPYLALLPRAKGNLVRQLFGDLHTYQEIADSEGIARSSAHEAVRRAVRDLTRRIAEDDPLFRPATDGRRRDYEEEARAARRVFLLYLGGKGWGR
jgi:hypothetical protein